MLINDSPSIKDNVTGGIF